MLSGKRLQQKVAPTAEKFRALGDANRFAILYLLAADPMDVGDIIDRTKLSPSLVAHHLKVLLQTGWVTKTKYGKLVTYYLVEGAVGELTKFFLK